MNPWLNPDEEIRISLTITTEHSVFSKKELAWIVDERLDLKIPGRIKIQWNFMLLFYNLKISLVLMVGVLEIFF